MRDDRAALDELVRRHLPVALRFAVRLTGSPHQAEEIVQNALVRVVRHWSKFRADADFRTWFYRIILNAFHDHLSARDQHGLASEFRHDTRQATPPEILQEQELGEQIAQQIAALPTRQREVLVLSVYESMSPAAVAELLGISVDTVYANLHLARKRLRAELRPYLDGKRNDLPR